MYPEKILSYTKAVRLEIPLKNTEIKERNRELSICAQPVYECVDR